MDPASVAAQSWPVQNPRFMWPPPEKRKRWEPHHQLPAPFEEATPAISSDTTTGRAKQRACVFALWRAAQIDRQAGPSVAVGLHQPAETLSHGAAELREMVA
jgi:hypothetical protein